MSRIASTFKRLAGDHRKALIPYVTAGDPQKDVTVPVMHALVKAGADVIELGVPFSDPMADGPVIQQACERALAHHTSLRDVLAMVREFRQQDGETPVVLMGYLNPVEVMGYEAFADACVEVGVDGVLLVDLPPEEAAEVSEMMAQRQLDLIFLVAPTTTDERLATISRAGSGYIYYVSLKGVTGSAALNPDDVAGKVETIRKTTELPIGVGFGIKDADSARRISAVADGVVVGSALVRLAGEYADSPEQVPDRMGAVVAEMRAAMDA
jgi:tryptophan synthase alpha chain